MKELYEDLYKACPDLSNFEHYAHFVGMKGRNYANNPVRFLLVGRAVNGWESLPVYNCEKYAEAAEASFDDVGRWSWVEDVNGVLYSKDGGKTEKRKRYCVSRSPFWVYSREIFKNISPSSYMGGVWMENISWSNLYKVAPNEGGNPSAALKKLQKNACRRILDKEIELLKPTHILFMTGVTGWYEGFEDMFPTVRRIDKKYVKAEGTYENAKICVSIRPEYKPKEAFVNEVTDSLKR